MECYATGSFILLPPNKYEEVADSLTLFVALSLSQFLQLIADKPMTPDSYSGIAAASASLQPACCSAACT